ncbi:hypothetical protein, partial [Proteus mirabilis]|uniref:hypothetical protein n=1 Tax=Proteus mirabilis TaxID=584 RepID=UPI00313C9C63
AWRWGYPCSPYRHPLGSSCPPAAERGDGSCRPPSTSGRLPLEGPPRRRTAGEPGAAPPSCSAAGSKSRSAGCPPAGP